MLIITSIIVCCVQQKDVWYCIVSYNNTCETMKWLTDEYNMCDVEVIELQ